MEKNKLLYTITNKIQVLSQRNTVNMGVFWNGAYFLWIKNNDQILLNNSLKIDRSNAGAIIYISSVINK